MRRHPFQGHRPGARPRQLSLPVLSQGVIGSGAALCAVCRFGFRDHARLAGAIPFLGRGHAHLLPPLRLAAHLSPCRPSRPFGHHDVQPRRSRRAAARLSCMDQPQAPLGGAIPRAPSTRSWSRSAASSAWTRVAVKWSELKVGRDGKDLTLTTDWTKDTLKACRTTSTSVASPFARAADGQVSRSAGPVRALPDGPFFLAGRKRGAGLRRRLRNGLP